MKKIQTQFAILLIGGIVISSFFSVKIIAIVGLFIALAAFYNTLVVNDELKEIRSYLYDKGVYTPIEDRLDIKKDEY